MRGGGVIRRTLAFIPTAVFLLLLLSGGEVVRAAAAEEEARLVVTIASSTDDFAHGLCYPRGGGGEGGGGTIVCDNFRAALVFGSSSSLSRSRPISILVPEGDVIEWGKGLGDVLLTGNIDIKIERLGGSSGDGGGVVIDGMGNGGRFARVIGDEAFLAVGDGFTFQNFQLLHGGNGGVFDIRHGGTVTIGDNCQFIRNSVVGEKTASSSSSSSSSSSPPEMEEECYDGGWSTMLFSSAVGATLLVCAGASVCWWFRNNKWSASVLAADLRRMWEEEDEKTLSHAAVKALWVMLVFGVTTLIIFPGLLPTVYSASTISVAGTTFTISSSTAQQASIDNDGWGGAFSVTYSGTLLIANDCTIYDCTSTIGGGGIYVYSSTVTIGKDMIMSYNEAIYGAHIYIRNNDATLTTGDGCTFLYGQANGQYGGTIAAQYGAYVNFGDNNHFAYNDGAHNGGVLSIYADSNTATLNNTIVVFGTDTIFESNTVDSDSKGAAIYFWSGDVSVVLGSGTIFTNNLGGGVPDDVKAAAAGANMYCCGHTCPSMFKSGNFETFTTCDSSTNGRCALCPVSTSPPTKTPTTAPSAAPSAAPSGAPSDFPTSAPSDSPTSAPSDSPTSAPSDSPTSAPSDSPTSAPSGAPSDFPSTAPSATPSDFPSAAPSAAPSDFPTSAPSGAPSGNPTVSPSDSPSATPTTSPAPSSQPSAAPSGAPTPEPLTEFWSYMAGYSTVAGSSSYIGGIAAGNGKIYCPPYHGNKVLIIDTLGQTFSFASNYTASTVVYGYFTAVLVDGRVYAAPYSSSSFLIIDTATDTATVLGGYTNVNDEAYVASVVTSEGFIVAPPHSADSILVVDPSTNNHAEIDVSDNLAPGITEALYAWAVVADDGGVYCPPLSSNKYMVIDALVDASTEIGFSTTFTMITGYSDTGYLKYWTGVKAGNGRIYSPPMMAFTILVVDPADDSFYNLPGYIKASSGQYQYAHSTLAPCGKLYSLPVMADEILIVDPSDDSWVYVAGFSGTQTPYSRLYYYGTLANDERIYGVPYDGSKVLAVDTNTDTYAFLGGYDDEEEGKYVSSVLVNGDIYGVPFEAGNILIIKPSGTMPPSPSPSAAPSAAPSSSPSAAPSAEPSAEPSDSPTTQPSAHPSVAPTVVPSAAPSTVPSAEPSDSPTTTPSSVPTSAPTASSCTDLAQNGDETDVDCGGSSCGPCEPGGSCNTDSDCSSGLCYIDNILGPACSSPAPTSTPTAQPSDSPSQPPSSVPSAAPSAVPSAVPSSFPSTLPSGSPTSAPSASPSAVPSAFPSSLPSVGPSSAPTSISCTDGFHNGFETDVDCGGPSCEACDSGLSCLLDTDCMSGLCYVGAMFQTVCNTPAPSPAPSTAPSADPSAFPSAQPSGGPSQAPSPAPSAIPSTAPSAAPSASPSAQPSGGPSQAPTSSPSVFPSESPSSQPSSTPTCSDGFKNQDETGVDCGGSSCGPCEPGDSCIADSDCSSGLCYIDIHLGSMCSSPAPTSAPTAEPSDLPSQPPSSMPSATPSSSSPSAFPSPEPSAWPSPQPSTVFGTVPPDVYLSVTGASKDTFDKYSLVNADVKLTLSAEVHSDYSTSFALQWDNGGLVSDELSSSTSLASLVINAGTLAAGGIYEFTLNAVDEFGAIGTGSITIVVNSPPYGGTLVATPQNGTALLTEFAVVADSWTDTDHLPLLFTFFYQDEEEATAVSIRTQGLSEVAGPVVLPAGSLDGDSGRLKLSVEIADSIGATFSDEVFVSVSLAPMEDMVDAVDEWISSTISTLNGSAAVSAISSCASVLNAVSEETDGSDAVSTGNATSSEAMTTVRSKLVLTLTQGTLDTVDTNDTSVLELLAATADLLAVSPEQINATASASAVSFVADIVGASVLRNEEDSQRLLAGTFPGSIVGALSSLLESSVFTDANATVAAAVGEESGGAEGWADSGSDNSEVLLGALTSLSSLQRSVMVAGEDAVYTSSDNIVISSRVIDSQVVVDNLVFASEPTGRLGSFTVPFAALAEKAACGGGGIGVESLSFEDSVSPFISRRDLHTPTAGLTLWNECDGTEMRVSDLEEADEISIAVPAGQGFQWNTSHQLVCVFWNTTTRDWSTEGCVMSAEDESSGEFTCTTNHLTSFAVATVFQAQNEKDSGESVFCEWTAADNVWHKLYSSTAYTGFLFGMSFLWTALFFACVFAFVRHRQQSMSSAAGRQRNRTIQRQYSSFDAPKAWLKRQASIIGIAFCRCSCLSSQTLRGVFFVALAPTCLSRAVYFTALALAARGSSSAYADRGSSSADISVLEEMVSPSVVCIELGNPSGEVWHIVRFIHDQAFPFMLFAASILFSYWHDLCSSSFGKLGAIKNLKFLRPQTARAVVIANGAFAIFYTLFNVASYRQWVSEEEEESLAQNQLRFLLSACLIESAGFLWYGSRARKIVNWHAKRGHQRRNTRFSTGKFSNPWATKRSDEGIDTMKTGSGTRRVSSKSITLKSLKTTDKIGKIVNVCSCAFLLIASDLFLLSIAGDFLLSPISAMCLYSVGLSVVEIFLCGFLAFAMKPKTGCQQWTAWLMTRLRCIQWWQKNSFDDSSFGSRGGSGSGGAMPRFGILRESGPNSSSSKSIGGGVELSPVVLTSSSCAAAAGPAAAAPASTTGRPLPATLPDLAAKTDNSLTKLSKMAESKRRVILGRLATTSSRKNNFVFPKANAGTEPLPPGRISTSLPRVSSAQRLDGQLELNASRNERILKEASGLTLNDVLSNNGALLGAFMDYLVHEHSVENLRFWLECQAFETSGHLPRQDDSLPTNVIRLQRAATSSSTPSVPQEALLTRAEAIYRTFVAPRSSNEVNISARQRTAIREALKLALENADTHGVTRGRSFTAEALRKQPPMSILGIPAETERLSSSASPADSDIRMRMSALGTERCAGITVPSDIFTAAKTEAFRLMKNDSFRRFLVSPFFIAHVLMRERKSRQEQRPSLSDLLRAATRSPDADARLAAAAARTFDVIDMNNDGAVSVSELVFFSRQQRSRSRPGTLAEELEMFSRIDVDGDGVISRPEFVTATAEMVASEVAAAGCGADRSFLLEAVLDQLEEGDRGVRATLAKKLSFVQTMRNSASALFSRDSFLRSSRDMMKEEGLPQEEAKGEVSESTAVNPMQQQQQRKLPPPILATRHSLDLAQRQSPPSILATRQSLI